MWKFWEKKSGEGVASDVKEQKLSKPKYLPQTVGQYLVVTMGKDPDWVWKLKTVERPHKEVKGANYFRIFDPVEAVRLSVMIRDYTSLDGRAELILYQGWYEKNSRKVFIEEKTDFFPQSA